MQLELPLVFVRPEPTLKDALHVISNEDWKLPWGNSRFAFHEPGSYWAYKHLQYTWGDHNIVEYEKYLELKDRMPPGFAVPEMVLLENTNYLATQFIAGEFAWDEENFEDPPAWVGDLEHELECYDLHGFNIITDVHGVHYVIDLF